MMDRTKPRILLFTGHRIDDPHRTAPRFPPELESAARTAIRNEIVNHDCAIGIASLARGGDILFHEACLDLGVENHIVLPFAPAIFLETSVRGVPSGCWESRFWRLWHQVPSVNRTDLGLERGRDAYSNCNQKMLEMATQLGPFHLIALWDGKAGDGPGGTDEMVQRAIQAGDEPTIINPRSLREGGTR
jgi:hypothetical protein